MHTGQEARSGIAGRPDAPSIPTVPSIPTRAFGRATPPLPSRAHVLSLSVALSSGAVLPVAATRKRGISRITIRVHADGSVTASIPWRSGAAGIRQTEDLLARKAAWIEQKLSERSTDVDWRHPERLVVSREEDAGSGQMILPLWGGPVDARRALELPAGLDLEAARAVGPAGELARRVMDLYAREVARALPAIAARAEQDMGLHATRWTVRSMVSRWGSCTPARTTIRIASQLAAYPPEFLDLIVRHELAHLVEQNHGPRFHALLEQAYPGHRAAQALLRLSPLEAAAELAALKRP